MSIAGPNADFIDTPPRHNRIAARGLRRHIGSVATVQRARPPAADTPPGPSALPPGLGEERRGERKEGMGGREGHSYGRRWGIRSCSSWKLVDKRALLHGSGVARIFLRGGGPHQTEGPLCAKGAHKITNFSMPVYKQKKKTSYEPIQPDFS